MKRRIFLKGTLASSSVAVALGAGLLNPRSVMAAWPANAFQAKNVPDALKAALGSDLTNPSNAIEITTPAIAENGASVPVTVSTTLPKVDLITLAVENNQAPLTATFALTGNAKGTVSTRVKMSKTSNVIAYVRSEGKVYTARKEVKVTVGGCGG
jgi:sulfur-oxidizing protein SoxY